MPQEGFGVFQVNDLKVCEQAVLDALDVGYRLIDTAQAYGNEAAVGKAIQASSVKREDIFLTTKVWVSNAGYELAQASIMKSMDNLQTDYLDLVLIHQPFGDYYGTYRALEELYKVGKIRAIGVSNFYPDRYVDLVKNVSVTPAVNQLETHVFNQRQNDRIFLEKYGTQIESWGPFAEGKNNLFQNPTLTKIGQSYNKTAAQVALRFLIQSGVVVIPKSTHKERMQQNFDIWDFVLNEQEMQQLQALDTGKSLFIDHYAGETAEMFNDRKL
ncbi:aldo/keto reductase [Bombilactobacillus bombi]|uniref:aldo/keto reductase n=1 Tax=Bombilactobacillus bombi TaxID=1303590 RepID=UPI001C627F41|nr:aldo/keto reductase [Bombilactobacillus bombi]